MKLFEISIHRTTRRKKTAYDSPSASMHRQPRAIEQNPQSQNRVHCRYRETSFGRHPPHTSAYRRRKTKWGSIKNLPRSHTYGRCIHIVAWRRILLAHNCRRRLFDTARDCAVVLTLDQIEIWRTMSWRAPVITTLAAPALSSNEISSGDILRQTQRLLHQDQRGHRNCFGVSFVQLRPERDG